MDKFQDYYRIPSARANWSDYTSDGFYFITFCAANRECIFGAIDSDQMILSAIGKIVNEEWNKSFEIRKELFCDKYVIMPNHIHAILRINNSVGHPDRSQNDEISNSCFVEGQSDPPIQSGSTGVAFRPPKSISSFVASFKSAVTVRVNSNTCNQGIVVWQTRFHDRIIRDKIEYDKIYWYIHHNIRNWNQDQYFS
jgi:REP element-mobilizing transposase RayT